MFMPFSLSLRVGIIVLFVWVASTSKPTHGVVLLGFLGGLAVLSLFSDNKLKKWFMMPEPPRTMKVPPIDPTCKGLVVHVGMEEEFKEHFADIFDEERILMAANLHTGTGQIWAVEQPGRHHHVCWTMDMMHVAPQYLSTQGFLTSYGRYVDRKEAALIAVSANQLLDMQEHPTRLFSESVWATPPWRDEDVGGNSSTGGLREPELGEADEVSRVEELHQRGTPADLDVLQCSAADGNSVERARAS
jgi:hypothetical protein